MNPKSIVFKFRSGISSIQFTLKGVLIDCHQWRLLYDALLSTNQEAEVDEHKQHFDAHRAGALAVSRWALFTAQFNDTLTRRLHSDGSCCAVTSPQP